MRCVILRALFGAAGLLAAVPGAQADACDAPTRQRLQDNILAEATVGAESVEVTCDVTLPKGRRVTKALYFNGASGNGVTVDCNSSTLDGGPKTVNAGVDMIAAAPRRESEFVWERPENIVIKNCTVLGSVRLNAMSFSDLHNSSRCHGPFAFDRPKCTRHTARAQAAAPRNIEFRNLRIVAQGHRTPVYFSFGTTHSKLVHSEITGKVQGGGVAIYLDAESADNVIQNNIIQVNTERREQIAVDGSARNLIAGNQITTAGKGGIFLYRNCGESGIVRIQSPQHNLLLNNTLRDVWPSTSAQVMPSRTPLIWVASRTKDPRDFCGLDDGLPFGSGVSDHDFALYNVIADNRFIGKKIADAIQADESPNEFFNNTAVAAASPRSSNCYAVDAFPRAHLQHEESTALSVVDGVPGCHGLQRHCRDGVVSTRAVGTCLKVDRVVVPFECSTTGSNRTAACDAKCPEGFVIESAKAACNLEGANVSDSLLAQQGWGTLEVQRASDHPAEGQCRLGANIARQNTLRMATPRRHGVAVSCQERDRNGGDCMIAGVLACVRPLQGPLLTPLPRK